jgi:DNA-binding NarL/FixJ family response regulator
MATTGQIGVFLLDDHEIVRKGVRDLLEAEPDIAVVGEAGTAESALARIPALRPDVAVLCGPAGRAARPRRATGARRSPSGCA